jgi:hypothetical protein
LLTGTSEDLRHCGPCAKINYSAFSGVSSF